MLTYMSLLQIRSTPISPRLLSPATLLLSGLSRCILPRFSRPNIVCHNDESNHTALISSKSQVSKGVDDCGNIFPVHSINCNSTARGWGIVNACNHSGAWDRRPQGKKPQNKSDKDLMHNHQNTETGECHPHISRIPQE